MNELFRTEAVAHATRRLHGDVLIATPHSLKLYTALCAAALVAAAIFLANASYARHETVIGWLVPRGGIIRATARQGGTLEALLVKENDVVRAGQPLARIRLSPTLAGGQDADAAADAALASEAGAVRAQAGAQRDKLLAEQRDLAPKLADLAQQLAEDRRQIAFQQEQVAIAQADLERFRKLAADGIVAVRLVDDRRAAMLSAEQSLSQLRANALGCEQQIADATARLHAIPADLAAASAGAVGAGAQIVQKRVSNQAQDADLVTAAVGGRVLAIPVEVGQTLSPGATVAIVTPRGAGLEAELYAPSRAVGFVRPGQAVRLMYQAFPHEKFGAASARVASVSRTILAPAEVAIPGVNTEQPVFRVRAALTAQAVHAYGQWVPLQPGMLLSADIVFDRRSLLEWLLDPIYAVRK